ncbi:ParA family protein [Cetobacterium sp. ZOR0034]|uniref:ParA family protein n=1 Tax=Cetobacterium sp. ZOR0034 TaxID=1339239 RepID=UPI00068EA759|nr:ParA family protein [Cetobacterium sp. ZOR0034]
MQVIAIKNNKGGVGKSWMTLQLAHGLQYLSGEDVLIITSDNQNNILEYAGMEKVETSTGLENWIKTGTGDVVRLREKLYFIPLKASHINSASKEKLSQFINNMRSKYKYILIDSTPMIGIDQIFVDLADKVVVPGFADKVTINSITAMLENIELSKLSAVVINKWTKTAKEKEYYRGLEEVLKGSDILLTVPISQSAIIGKLIDEGKTIWECNSKRVEATQEVFKAVLEAIL